MTKRNWTQIWTTQIYWFENVYLERVGCQRWLSYGMYNLKLTETRSTISFLSLLLLATSSDYCQWAVGDVTAVGYTELFSTDTNMILILEAYVEEDVQHGPDSHPGFPTPPGRLLPP